MSTQQLTAANSAAFTTTAGTEAVIACLWIPTEAIAEAQFIGNCSWSAVNAATTALAVKIRQATVSGGNLVVSAPAGTQIGATATEAFTAGTLTATTVPIGAVDLAPVAITSDITIPAQAASLNMPGLIPAGGFLYVLTVTSTTNVATVAAQASSLTVMW